MTTINLRDYYPFYHEDVYVEVTDDVAEAFFSFRRADLAYQRKLYRHNANFSLDCEDGIIADSISTVHSPEDIYALMMTREQLLAAVTSLPDKQAKRIYAHFFLGLNISDIARLEGVHKVTVQQSIRDGLSNLELLCRHLKG